ncbi:TRAP transporter small permease [Volucribacter amazonae]|uniref:TRAP transporter small permease protein n=1 Tax=Volucribacter amazonae TaxID=256731 RepID=A0A9X4PAS1_9PAST|nr:TRAP transporter small permease [Volucribacter amazonae]MDG6895715.1 C4-dicarboxylate ABC transporter permease [Volucribacter amazonae]
MSSSSNLLATIKLWVDKFMQWLCIAIVGLMCVLVTYQVVTRYVFNAPSAVSEVLARYLFIWLILFGGAYVFGCREHLSIAYVKQKLSAKGQIFADMISELAILLFTLSIMLFGGYHIAMRQMWQMDSALQLPMGVIYSAIPLAGIIILFYALYNQIQLVKKWKTLG